MTELANTNKAKELAIVKQLNEQGLDDKFIAEALKTIVTKAMTQNNQGDLIEDYGVRLRALQTILKIKDKNYDRGGVNVNFFAAPPIDDLKY